MTKTQVFILGWIGIIQSLLMIFTLGFYWPEFQADYIGYCIIKNFDEEIERRENKI